jgi:hypothetical protein
MGKQPAQEVEMASTLDIEAVATHQSEIHHLNEKVFDGDEAPIMSLILPRRRRGFYERLIFGCAV